MKCINCQNELKETDKFCGICGTPNPYFKDGSTMGEEKALDTAETIPPKNKEKKTAPLWLCIFLIVIIFILSAACGVLLQLYMGG